MAKFKTDENLPMEVAALLSANGHDAMTVLDQEMGGHTDDDLSVRCREEERAIVTFDLDFADIRAYPPENHFGIVVLRLERQDKPHVMEVFERLVPKLDDEPLTGKLWIVTEETIRIRG